MATKTKTIRKDVRDLKIGDVIRCQPAFKGDERPVGLRVVNCNASTYGYAVVDTMARSYAVNGSTFEVVGRADQLAPNLFVYKGRLVGCVKGSASKLFRRLAKVLGYTLS